MKSSKKPVKCGVSQGSILSPILFLIFINDAFNLPLKGQIRMYADDSALNYENEDQQKLQQDMNHNIQILDDWFASNKMAMNVRKTQFMLFQTKNSKTDLTNFTVTLDNNKLDRVKSFKYLGLMLDENLTWEENVKYVANKIAPYVGILGRIKHTTHEKTKLQIYHAYINSHLMYMCHLWSTATSTRLHQIEMLQNKALRRISCQLYMSPHIHTRNLYIHNKILPLSDMSKLTTAIATYKITNNFTKSDIIFKTNAEFHQYATRTRQNLHPPKPNNNHGKKCITYRGATILNGLPPHIKNATSLNSFKSKLKTHLIRNL